MVARPSAGAPESALLPLFSPTIPRSTLSRAASVGLLATASLLAPLAAAVPAALAANPPKVVIVVGPVAGTTPSYKADADKAAAAALAYTPNVVKVYTPNATWDAVKSALQGASV